MDFTLAFRAVCFLPPLTGFTALVCCRLTLQGGFSCEPADLSWGDRLPPWGSALCFQREVRHPRCFSWGCLWKQDDVVWTKVAWLTGRWTLPGADSEIPFPAGVLWVWQQTGLCVLDLMPSSLPCWFVWAMRKDWFAFCFRSAFPGLLSPLQGSFNPSWSYPLITILCLVLSAGQGGDVSRVAKVGAETCPLPCSNTFFCSPSCSPPECPSVCSSELLGCSVCSWGTTCLLQLLRRVPAAGSSAAPGCSSWAPSELDTKEKYYNCRHSPCFVSFPVFNQAFFSLLLAFPCRYFCSGWPDVVGVSQACRPFVPLVSFLLFLW